MNSSSEPWCPSLDHIKTKDFQDVYDPVEDTYALSDAIQADRSLLNDTVKPKICVEVGSGSGYISAVLSHVLGGRAFVLSTDVNTRAAQITAATMGANGAGGVSNSVVCDLVGPLAERLRHSVDVLVFNPPYVPTDEEEYQLSVKTHDISAAWAGGPTGTAVLDRLIPHISELLSEKGCFYLVAISENDPENIMRQLSEYGLHSKVVVKRRGGCELLYIIRSSPTEY